MLFEEISLTPQDILDKEFKIDTRGYRPQEVDKFLDVIIGDYTKFIALVKRLDSEKKALIEDNLRLKKELREAQDKIELLKNIIDEIGDKQIIIWCQFQHEIETLSEKFSGVGLRAKT